MRSGSQPWRADAADSSPQPQIPSIRGAKHQVFGQVSTRSWTLLNRAATSQVTKCLTPNLAAHASRASCMPGCLHQGARVAADGGGDGRQRQIREAANLRAGRGGGALRSQALPWAHAPQAPHAPHAPHALCPSHVTKHTKGAKRTPGYMVQAIKHTAGRKVWFARTGKMGGRRIDVTVAA